MSSAPTESVVVPAWSLREAARPGLHAIRDHLRPFLLIQVCAVLLVVAYYNSLEVQGFSAHLASVKVHGGFLFAAISTAFAGVVLPEAFKAVTRDARRYRLRELVFNFLVFGLNGILVDSFYRAQGVVIGQATGFGTIAAKVCVDQFFFSPFVAVPFVLALFQLRDSNFDFRAAYRALGPKFMRNRVLPVQIVAWAFWGPMTSAVYALPPNLQFCLFLLAEAAWSLLLIHVAKGQAVTK